MRNRHSRQRLRSFSNALSSTASFFNGWRSTPGTTPATSQLDKLISITAINVLSCFRTIRDWFRSFGVCIGGLHRFTSATMDTISPPPPHSIFPLASPARFSRSVQVDHRHCRPAANETVLGLRRAVGTEVVHWLGANKPAYKLDPGFLEHPRLSPRAVIGPGARFLTSYLRDPTPTTQHRRRRWSCCIDDVAVSTFTKRRWWPAYALYPMARSRPKFARS